MEFTKGLLKVVITAFFLACYEFYGKPFVMFWFGEQNISGFSAVFLGYLIALVGGYVTASAVVSAISWEGEKK